MLENAAFNNVRLQASQNATILAMVAQPSPVSHQP